MKKIVFTLLILMFSTQIILATEKNDVDISLNLISDGEYYLTVIENVDLPKERLCGFPVLASQQTATKSKTTYYKNSSGETLWYVRVTGTFTYGNGFSKCISFTPSAESNNSAWKISNVNGNKIENTAKASATGKYIVRGKVVDTKQKSVYLTCSPTGVFS